MINYPKILFPVDLSKAAPQIAGHVAAMVEKFDAELHLVHVIPAYDSHVFPAHRAMDEIKARAGKELEGFVSKHFMGISKVATHVATGHTGRQILNYAEKNDVSLIIMGTHGRSEIGRILFGSVAMRVVQSAHIPVMTVHPYHHELEAESD